jgi:hypothetical protein
MFLEVSEEHEVRRVYTVKVWTRVCPVVATMGRLAGARPIEAVVTRGHN